MLSAVRDYHLYIYYWYNIKDAERSGSFSCVLGFGVVTVWFNLWLIGIYALLRSFYPETMDAIYDYLGEVFGRTRTYKGGLNIGFALVLTPLAMLICYLVCCFRIRFEDIPKRLEKNRFLSEFAWWKFLLPFGTPLILQMLNMIIF